MKTNSLCINYMQYNRGYSVWRRHIISKVEDIQYRCVTLSVWRSTSSVRWRVCCTDLTCHQYRGGCAVQDYQNCSRGGGGGGGYLAVFYLGKMTFYRQSYCNPDFILLWLNQDVAQIPLGC